MDTDDDNAEYIPSPPMGYDDSDDGDDIPSPPGELASDLEDLADDEPNQALPHEESPQYAVDVPAELPNEAFEIAQAPVENMDTNNGDAVVPTEEQGQETITDPDELERTTVIALAKQKDAILEPGVAELVSRYRKANGAAGTLMATMATSFTDYPGKTQLLMETLCDSGLEQPHVERNALEFAKRWVTSHFDADAVNEEIAQQHQARGSVNFVLPVLETMIGDSAWREVFLGLAQASTKESFFLTQGLRTLVANGHHQSAAELDRLAQDQNLFTEVLIKELQACLSTSDPMVYHQHLKTLIAMASNNLPSYSLLQGVLVQLHDKVSPRAKLTIEALSERIEEAVTQSSLDVGHISHLLVTREPAHASAVGLLATMVTGGSVASAEVHRLHQLYLGDYAPPAGLLQRRRILDVLLNAIFAGHKTDRQQLKKYTHLLSIAVSFPPDQCPTNLAGNSSFQQLSTLLQQVHEALHYGSLTPSVLATLNNGIDHSVIAQGLLLWLRRVMLQDEFFITFSAATPLPHLRMLDQITVRQPQLHADIIDVISACLTTNYPIDARVLQAAYQCLMDRLLVLSHHGFAIPVVTSVVNMADDVTYTILDYFVTELLKMIEPPYSLMFVQALLPLLQRVRQAIPANQKLPEAVIAFLKEGAVVAHDTASTAEAIALLHDERADADN
eukprot:m.144691 g.144691  ORF g.144691 m.144691 type:complete len:675 (+) comp16204_c0_seq5:95-2119(+)